MDHGQLALNKGRDLIRGGKTRQEPAGLNRAPGLQPLQANGNILRLPPAVVQDLEFEVQRAWVEKFIYEARCPVCDIMLNEKDVLRGTCAEGHRFLKEEK